MAFELGNRSSSFGDHRGGGGGRYASPPNRMCDSLDPMGRGLSRRPACYAVTNPAQCRNFEDRLDVAGGGETGGSYIGCGSFF